MEEYPKTALGVLQSIVVSLYPMNGTRENY